ncbi:hypothetical protein Pcinc_032576 [Petrolisthes cinctipes]|uniref:Uncharacterized protein n=1 Tax=Petrolisthes cinctipes TaxID=88211 RepID=A0AAE1EU55_PETCI|nr:hypothetical protein Pcinc_032576 [Petrolisthes cinctipes]
MKHLILNLAAVLVMMATLITAGQKEELHNDNNKVGDMILQLVKHYFLDCYIILQTTTISHSPVLSPLIRWAGLGLVQLVTSNDSIIPFEMWQDRRTTCSVVILHLGNNNFNNSSNSAFR